MSLLQTVCFQFCMWGRRCVLFTLFEQTKLEEIISAPLTQTQQNNVAPRQRHPEAHTGSRSVIHVLAEWYVVLFVWN